MARDRAGGMVDPNVLTNRGVDLRLNEGLVWGTA